MNFESAELMSECDMNANCTNTEGSYECGCNEGYEGDGYIGNCTNVDECELGWHNCDVNANCTGMFNNSELKFYAYC